MHPKNARMSGQHGVQHVAQCVACAALTLVVWVVWLSGRCRHKWTVLSGPLSGLALSGRSSRGSSYTPRSRRCPPHPHGGVRPFHQKSTCLTQLTLGPCVVQIWSHITPESGPNETLVLHCVGGDTHTHTLSLSLTHTLSLSRSLSFFDTHTLSLFSLSLFL